MATASASNLSGGAIWGQTYNYDRFGNMTCVTGGVAGCNSTITYATNTATNQITTSGYQYDAAGNLTQQGTGTGSYGYTWDGERRLATATTPAGGTTTTTYTYNALGQRVEKNASGTYTEYFFDASGGPVGENNRPSWGISVVSFGGGHLAHYQSGATNFMHGNKIGSTSEVTDYSGAMAQDQLYYPWGQEWTMAGTAQEKRFASLQHRDSETTLDPTHFRMLSSNQGRWLSADLVRGRPYTPQSLNRYGYVLNNPLRFIDRLGLQGGCEGSSKCGPTTPSSFNPTYGVSGTSFGGTIDVSGGINAVGGAFSTAYGYLGDAAAVGVGVVAMVASGGTLAEAAGIAEAIPGAIGLLGGAGTALRGVANATGNADVAAAADALASPVGTAVTGATGSETLGGLAQTASDLAQAAADGNNPVALATDIVAAATDFIRTAGSDTPAAGSPPTPNKCGPDDDNCPK